MRGIVKFRGGGLKVGGRVGVDDIDLWMELEWLVYLMKDYWE